MSKPKSLDDLTIEELKGIQDYLANEFSIITAKIMRKEMESNIYAKASKQFVDHVEKGRNVRQPL